MSNRYINQIMEKPSSFGWIAKDNYTSTERGKIWSGLIGVPDITAPTRWKHTKEVAYNLSKERATGKRGTKTRIGYQTNPPTSTKTAAFIGAIYTHKLRIRLKDNRLKDIADQFYRDGDSKSGLFAWSLNPVNISKAGDNVVKRLTSELANLGYKILPKDQSEPGSKERSIYAILQSMVTTFKQDEISQSKKNTEAFNLNPLELLNAKEASRMVNKYGTKLYTEEFPNALMERADTAGIKIPKIPYCFREPKKCAYITVGGILFVGAAIGTVKLIAK